MCTIFGGAAGLASQCPVRLAMRSAPFSLQTSIARVSKVAEAALCWSPNRTCRTSCRGALVVNQAGKGFGAPAKAANTDSADKPCACGSDKPYSGCCQPFHDKVAKPAEPESALRARFSAYALKDAKYIIKSTHPRNSAIKGSEAVAGSLARKVKTTFDQDVRASMNFSDVSNLTLQGVEPGNTEDEAFVEFQYTLKQVRSNAGEKLSEPRVHTVKERAKFQRRQGEWLLLGSESNWDNKELRTTS